MQLCLMTARIANGGYDVEPRIVLGEKSKFSLFAEKRIQSHLKNFHHRTIKRI